MYDILELNKKLLPELKEVAKELGIKKFEALKKTGSRIQNSGYTGDSGGRKN